MKIPDYTPNWFDIIGWFIVAMNLFMFVFCIIKDARDWQIIMHFFVVIWLSMMTIKETIDKKYRR